MLWKVFALIKGVVKLQGRNGSPVGASADNLRVDDASSRAHRQLFNHQYAGKAYDDLGIIVNNNGIAVTLNDGSLIYKG